MNNYIIINYKEFNDNNFEYIIVICKNLIEASVEAFKLLKHQNYHVQLFKVDKEVII